MPSFLQAFLPPKATAVDQCVSTSPFYALCFPQDRAAQEHNPSFIYSWSHLITWLYCLGYLGSQGIWEFISYTVECSSFHIFKLKCWLIKFSFTEKAQKICAILLMVLTFTKQMSNNKEDGANFCGLLRKAEL